MSTKIFNGYKIDKDMSANELMNLIIELNKNCQDICNDIYNKEVAKFVSLCLDTKLIFGEDEMNDEVYFKYSYSPTTKSNHLFIHIRELVKQHSNSNERNQSSFDFKCRVKLLPTEDKTLFLLYTQKEEYLKLFGYTDKEGVEYSSEIYPNISPYMYYNNTDKPKHISCDEWDIRRDDWDDALRNNEKGFIYDLTTTPSVFNIELVNKHLANMYEERIDRLVSDKLNSIFNDRYDRFMCDDDVSKYIKEFKLYQESDEYKEKFKEIKADIEKILPKTYSKEEFNQIKLSK